MRKKHDNELRPSASKHGQRHIGEGIASRVFVPIHIHDPYGSSRRSFAPRPPSLWERLLAWLRYYTIQLRWDVERWLARRGRIHNPPD